MTGEFDIRLNEGLGQHLLMDKEALAFIGSQVESGANVIEIGSGPGNLTAALAQRANKVIGLEIDRRFEPQLAKLTETARNVEITFTDALKARFDQIISRDRSREWQIVGNIPYHISEPLLFKFIGLPVEDIILVVGDNLAYTLQLDNPDDLSFSKLSLLGQTFFDIQMLRTLTRDCFYPQPRTESALVRLTPRSAAEFNHTRLKVQRALFLSESRMPTVKKVLAESLVLAGEQEGQFRSKTENSRHARRAIRQDLKMMLRGEENGRRQKSPASLSVDQLALSGEILNQPFARLDNQQIRELAAALRLKFGD